jgi:hypothetical protein
MFITGDVTKKAGGKLPFVFSKKNHIWKNNTSDVRFLVIQKPLLPCISQSFRAPQYFGDKNSNFRFGFPDFLGMNHFF